MFFSTEKRRLFSTSKMTGSYYEPKLPKNQKLEVKIELFFLSKTDPIDTFFSYTKRLELKTCL